MRFSKAHICVTRTKPRHPAEPQKAVLAECGCGDWVDLDRPDGWTALAERLRRGDQVKVRHLHILVPQKRRTDDNPQRALWAAIWAIEDRGATVFEAATGRSTADARTRDEMIRDAIDAITRGARGPEARIARANGKLGGRPAARIKDEDRAAARALWFERPDLRGARLHQALRKLRYSVARCYREFGARSGQ